MVLSYDILVMAAIAAAAFSSMTLRTEFKPAMSTMDGMSVMSDSPM